MIAGQDQFSIISLNSVAEITPKTILTADMLQIDGYQPGGIYHSKYIRWQVDITEMSTFADLLRSKKSLTKFNRTQQIASQLNFTVKCVPLDKNLFDRFYAIYKKTTILKPRFQDYHIQQRVVERLHRGAELYIIGLYDKQQELDSALVFEKRDVTAHVGFTALQRNSVFPFTIYGLLLDELFKFCKNNSVTIIDRGKSLNPAGIISTLGLFESKCRFGLLPCPEGKWVTSFILHRYRLTEDSLLFVTFDRHELIAMVVKDNESDDSDRFKNALTPKVIVKSGIKIERLHNRLVRDFEM